MDRLFDHHKQIAAGGAITTEGLLNALDGVGTPEGRIIIITANFPEHLPDAMFRPGRIDNQFDFRLLTWKQDRKILVDVLKVYHKDAMTNFTAAMKKTYKKMIGSLGQAFGVIQMSRLQELMLYTIHMESMDEVMACLEKQTKKILSKTQDKNGSMYA